MPRSLASLLVLVFLLPLQTALAGPASLELPEGMTVDLETLQKQVVGKGCAGRLLGRKEHPFAEAQVTCDAFLSFALVQASLEGKAPPDVRERWKALLADALGRARAPFRGTGSYGARRSPASRANDSSSTWRS